MYEIEIKAKLRNRKTVMKKLKDFGCKFGEELHQVDHIFLPKGTPFPSPFDVPVLRVRKQNNEYIFTLKISQGSRQDSLERELKISDGKMMLQILNMIGYEEFIPVDKKRIKTNYKDMEIVLDNVKHLGEFIEIEKIVKHKNHEDRKKIQEKLFDFLEIVGVSKSDVVLDGKYDIMLYEKMKSK
ncbi:class IV adenylate cyclase [Candidatus Nomurabacteria bacterium]|nr:class IV adenylate cyclase [Candidatus Nomurabacteria bacterium]